MDGWLWQGILTSVFATLLWAGGATVLTWIKSRWPKYGDLALYWFASAACIAILWFATTGYIPFSRPQPQVTPDNIQANVKMWSENLGLAFTSTSVPDAYFGYMLTTRTGTPIQVMRLRKEKPAYLQFATTLQVAPEHQAILGTLTKDQFDAVVQELALELAKTRVGFSILTMGVPQTGNALASQTGLLLQRASPITSLNEERFAQCTDDLEFTVQLVRATLALSLRRATASQSTSARVRKKE